MDRGPERQPGAVAPEERTRQRRPMRGGADGPDESRDESREAAEPSRTERFAVGAETGVRRIVQSVAVLLWIPFGFVFWLPFLLRRTVAYVFAVLHAGLVGGETDRAERRWEQAVGFYQLGFRRILRAFSSEEEKEARESARGGPRETEDGLRRLLLETAWAVVVWGAILWLTGIWPDAPETVRSMMLGAWEALAAAARQIDAWTQELLRR